MGQIQIAQGPILAHSGTLLAPASTINFGRFMAVSDNAVTLKTTVTVNTGGYLNDQYDIYSTRIVNEHHVVDDYFSTQIINPGNPPSGSVAYVSGGYLHVRDHHAGHATFDAVTRMDLSNANQSVFIGSPSTWGYTISGSIPAWGSFYWGFEYFANDFWLWKNTLTENRTYTIGAEGAATGSTATFWLTDDSNHTVNIYGSGSLGLNLLFTKPTLTGSIVSLVFDGTDWFLDGFKRML